MSSELYSLPYYSTPPSHSFINGCSVWNYPSLGLHNANKTSLGTNPFTFFLLLFMFLSTCMNESKKEKRLLVASQYNDYSCMFCWILLCSYGRIYTILVPSWSLEFWLLEWCFARVHWSAFVSKAFQGRLFLEP